MKSFRRVAAILMMIFFMFFLGQAEVLQTSAEAVKRPSRTKKALYPPGGISAVNITSNEIEIKWDTVPGALGYRVYITYPNDSSFSRVYGTKENSFKFKALSPNTKYSLYVVAYNKFLTSTKSKKLDIKTAQFINKKVYGFATYYNSKDASSLQSMKENLKSIDNITTHTYISDENGNIKGLVPKDQLSLAKQNNISAIAMVSNNFNGEVAKKLLQNEAARKKLISNIISEVKAYGYIGVNVDFEGLFYYNRNGYTEFIKELYTELHKRNYQLVISVPAKTRDSISNSWTGAYDYKALSAYSDSIVLMTYDEHYFGGKSGPVASLGWVKSVVNYAVTVIPRNKIILGVAAYGYDWSSEGGKAYSIDKSYSVAVSNNSRVMWDAASQTPYYKYTDSKKIEHEVWFENAASMGLKLDIVNKEGLAGIAIWRLGLEDKDYWNTIRNRFNLKL